MYDIISVKRGIYGDFPVSNYVERTKILTHHLNLKGSNAISVYNHTLGVHSHFHVTNSISEYHTDSTFPITCLSVTLGITSFPTLS